MSDENKSPEPEATTDEKPKPSWKRRLGSWAIQGLILIVVLLIVTEFQARGLISRQETAPAFELATLSGERQALSASRGKVTVVYFFAPWCSVCTYASKNIVALRNARDAEDLEVLAVGLGYERREDVERFARDHHLNVPVLLGTQAVQTAYQVKAFPTVYVIDEQGKVQDRVIGYTTELGLRLRSL